MKTLTGFDYFAVRFPQDHGREQLESLDFINHAQDPVLHGDVGTGKTHMPPALVMMLRRAKDEDRLDEELDSLAKNQLIAIDEPRYLPIDTERAPLLFQVIADGYEKRRLIITTNLEFSRWGTVFCDDTMASAIILDNYSPHLSTRGDTGVGDWAAANNVKLADAPFYGSWLHRIEPQFTALCYFALDGTDHPSHQAQGSLIRCFIIWRNHHATAPKLRKVVRRASLSKRAKVA